MKIKFDLSEQVSQFEGILDKGKINGDKRMARRNSTINQEFYEKKIIEENFEKEVKLNNLFIMKSIK